MTRLKLREYVGVVLVESHEEVEPPHPMCSDTLVEGAEKDMLRLYQATLV
jgi:hypothetical protein